jgi:hypothetical protein
MHAKDLQTCITFFVFFCALLNKLGKPTCSTFFDHPHPLTSALHMLYVLNVAQKNTRASKALRTPLPFVQEA